MKLGNRDFTSPRTKTITFRRGDGLPVVFTAQMVRDYSRFDELCPVPKAPIINSREHGEYADVTDPVYKDAVTMYYTRRDDWTLIQALKATKDLTWETIHEEKPETWANWKKELKDVDFSDVEINLLHRAVFIANGLDPELMEIARNSF